MRRLATSGRYRSRIVTSTSVGWALRGSNRRPPPCKGAYGAREAPGHSLDICSDLHWRLSLFVVGAQRLSTLHGLGTDLRRPIRRVRLHPNRPSPRISSRGPGLAGAVRAGGAASASSPSLSKGGMLSRRVSREPPRLVDRSPGSFAGKAVFDSLRGEPENS